MHVSLTKKKKVDFKTMTGHTNVGPDYLSFRKIKKME